MCNENERGGLKGSGRTNDKKSYSGKCDVRLSTQEDAMLNSLAQRNNVSRSDVMRKALRDFWKFNGGE